MNVGKARKYVAIAEAVAALSKDSSTKVGALIIGQTHEIRSLGYNGAPRGCSADEDERGEVRPEKYFWMEHAERNAIFNAARVGTPVEGCSLVVTAPPCMDCARAIVQAGIRHVIWKTPDESFAARWAEHSARVLALFDECGITWETI